MARSWVTGWAGILLCVLVFECKPWVVPSGANLDAVLVAVVPWDDDAVVPPLNLQLLRSGLAEGYRGVVRENVPLRKSTHLRVGGAAAFFAEPTTESDVQCLVRVCRELDVPLHVLGGGSNLVVADEGVPGVVMSLERLSRIVRDGERVTASAGVTLPSLLRATKDLGLAGLEVLSGVPAHVGGAVAMNAGTRDGETFDTLVSLTVVRPDGELAVLAREDCSPRYRDGGLDGSIALHASFELKPEPSAAIFERFRASLERRNATQPVTEPSVGCVFQNPEGGSAGALIEAAGLKLERRGGISVSGKHANYFVNDGEGTCADFMALLEAVRDRVHETAGVTLEPEVKFWGL